MSKSKSRSKKRGCHVNIVNSNMSVDNLPTEIIERILDSLNLADLESCRLVNRRWYDLSSVVLDSRWRKICQGEFPDTWAEARRKSQYKLTWEQLYRSLSLGPNINVAKISCYSKRLGRVKSWKGVNDHKRQFIILSNGLIATPIYTNKKALPSCEGKTDDDVKKECKLGENAKTEETAPVNKKLRTSEYKDDIFVAINDFTSLGCGMKTEANDRKVLNDASNEKIDSETELGPTNKKRKVSVKDAEVLNQANEKHKETAPNTAENTLICNKVDSEKILMKTRNKKTAVDDKNTVSDINKNTVEKSNTAAKTRKRGARQKTAEVDTVKVENEEEKEKDFETGNDKSKNVSCRYMKTRSVTSTETSNAIKTRSSTNTVAQKGMRTRSSTANKNNIETVENANNTEHNENVVANKSQAVDAIGDKAKNQKAHVKNKKGQTKTKKDTTKKDCDDMSTVKNNLSSAKNDTDDTSNANKEEMGAKIEDTVNKENVSLNNNNIQNIDQNTVNTDSTAVNSTLNGKPTKSIKKKRILRKKKETDNNLKNVPCSNSILYLDIDTLAEHHLEKYDFNFNKYAETEDLIVFRSCQGTSCKLIIGYKMDGSAAELHTVGDMKMHGQAYTDFFIINSSVYYQDESETLIKVSPKTDMNGKRTPETKCFTSFTRRNAIIAMHHPDHMTILSIARGNEDTVNVLTDVLAQKAEYTLGQSGRIYSLDTITGEFNLLDVIKGSDQPEARQEMQSRLAKCGFEWTDSSVFAWLSGFMNITKLKRPVVHRHHKVIILASSVNTLHIHSKPFGYSNKKIQLHYAKPAIKIDLRKLILFDKEIAPNMSKISQIDSVPTKNGMKIVILVAEMIVIVNLTHSVQPELFRKSKPKTRSTFWGRARPRDLFHDRYMRWSGSDSEFDYDSDEGYNNYYDDSDDDFGGFGGCSIM